jgi:hypothetical protein
VKSPDGSGRTWNVQLARDRSATDPNTVEPSSLPDAVNTGLSTSHGARPSIDTRCAIARTASAPAGSAGGSRFATTAENRPSLFAAPIALSAGFTWRTWLSQGSSVRRGVTSRKTSAAKAM